MADVLKTLYPPSSMAGPSPVLKGLGVLKAYTDYSEPGVAEKALDDGTITPVDLARWLFLNVSLSPRPPVPSTEYHVRRVIRSMVRLDLCVVCQTYRPRNNRVEICITCAKDLTFLGYNLRHAQQEFAKTNGIKLFSSLSRENKKSKSKRPKSKAERRRAKKRRTRQKISLAKQSAGR